MPRKFFRKYLPTQDYVRRHKYLGRFGAWFHHPNLWHLNRRSVAGGVAVGMFTGLIPGPFQMLGSVILAIPLRVNLPVALLTTFYTNPFTIGPLYVVAYYIGRFLVGGGQFTPMPEFHWAELGAWMHALLGWTVSHGKPLAVGLVVLALLLSALGYVVVQLAWRAYVVHAWRRRRALREARA